MKNYNKKSLLVLLVSLIILLSACSTGSTNTMERIKKEGKFTYAMTGQYPPYNFINDEGNVDGFDIDIATAIGEKLGVEAKAITTEWDGIIGGLNGNRFDIIIGSMAVTEERLKEVNFTRPYNYEDAQFFAMKGSGLESIKDLKDGKVGVVTGTTFDLALKEYDNISEVLQFSSDVDNFMAAKQGRSDGLVTASLVGARAPEKYGVDIEPVGDPLYVEKVAMAIRKEDKEFLDAVNKALNEMIEDGTYEEISRKWFDANLLEGYEDVTE